VISLDPLGEVLARVDDGVVAAVCLGQRRLLVGTDGADHGDAQCPRPLADDQADTAGRGMDQDGVARLHRAGTAQQVLRSHALQHHRRAGLEVDRVGQLDQTVGRNVAHLCIGADRAAGIGDAVADLQFGNRAADGFDHPGALKANAGGHRQRIGTGAMVDVDVVEADGVVAHARLVRRRVANADFFPAQDFGAAGGVKADGVAHAVSFDVWNVKGRTLPRAGGNFNRRLESRR
jgi:hypothetical protein